MSRPLSKAEQAGLKKKQEEADVDRNKVRQKLISGIISFVPKEASKKDVKQLKTAIRKAYKQYHTSKGTKVYTISDNIVDLVAKKLKA